ncbi:MAG: MFS transporter [Pseudomonadota bacterium]
MGAVPTKPTAIGSLTLIMLGGAFVKPVISGTVARASDEVNRARAFSLFYLVVNIGSFSGKALAKPLRTGLGLESINYASAAFSLAALVVVLFLYREPPGVAVSRPPAEVLRGLLRVVKNLRFMALLIIVGGFWAIQQQLYATLPKYVLRVVGEGAAPEWYANINPLVVVLLVVPVTQAVRRLQPVTAIAIALGLIPIAALLMGLSPWLGDSVHLAGLVLHPVTVTMVAGIALQGLAECFLSPRFLEFTSKQAPEGETGLYMGYSYLTSFFGNILGFGMSGYLLERWCPDPATQPAAVQAAWSAAIEAGTPLPEAWAHAHFIWYVFAGVGLAAFVALLAFAALTRASERGR